MKGWLGYEVCSHVSHAPSYSSLLEPLCFKKWAPIPCRTLVLLGIMSLHQKSAASDILFRMALLSMHREGRVGFPWIPNEPRLPASSLLAFACVERQDMSEIP